MFTHPFKLNPVMQNEHYHIWHLPWGGEAAVFQGLGRTGKTGLEFSKCMMMSSVASTEVDQKHGTGKLSRQACQSLPVSHGFRVTRINFSNLRLLQAGVLVLLTVIGAWAGNTDLTSVTTTFCNLVANGQHHSDRRGHSHSPFKQSDSPLYCRAQ